MDEACLDVECAACRPPLGAAGGLAERAIGCCMACGAYVQIVEGQAQPLPDGEAEALKPETHTLLQLARAHAHAHGRARLPRLE